MDNKFPSKHSIDHYNDLLAIKLAAICVVKHLGSQHPDSPEMKLLDAALNYEKARRDSSQARDAVASTITI